MGLVDHEMLRVRGPKKERWEWHGISGTQEIIWSHVLQPVNRCGIQKGTSSLKPPKLDAHDTAIPQSSQTRRKLLFTLLRQNILSMSLILLISIRVWLRMGYLFFLVNRGMESNIGFVTFWFVSNFSVNLH